jgi:hypothetical protein
MDIYVSKIIIYIEIEIENYNYNIYLLLFVPQFVFLQKNF